MFLLNLSLAELLAILGVLSSAVVALYLLDRSRRRQTVATLRFWKQAEAIQEPRRKRRRIQQPLSLALQLVSIALLLLAIAQLRFGTRESVARDHVLILDTSAWMDARSVRGSLMEEARSLARAWLRALPAGDRVMLVRADALATPATGFESSRKLVEEAVNRSEPGATALEIRQALELARRIQTLHAARAGEVVFVGAGRVRQSEGGPAEAAPSNLRVLPVTDRIENCGLRQVGLRHSVSDPALWEVYVSVRNYGEQPRAVTLALGFGEAPAGTRRLSLAPGTEQSATFELRTHAAGWLEARLLPEDGFPADNRAVLELPPHQMLHVTVYSESPGWLRPMLAANPNVEAQFRPVAQYDPALKADLVILDRFRPPQPPKIDSVWVEPPERGSPVEVRATLHDAVLSRWRSDHPLATGLRVQDLRLASAQVFAPEPGDVAVAEVEQGPVILARFGPPKMVFLGFHPSASALRYELATPLIFANILRWMSPEVFRRWELNAGSAGTVVASLDREAAGVRVLAEDGRPLPFTRQGSSLRFFAGQPGTVRVLAGDRELVYSLSLPEVPLARWEPPREARRGIPSFTASGPSWRDIWPLLALLGAIGLLVDWLLFGHRRGPATQSATAGRSSLGLRSQTDRKAS